MRVRDVRIGLKAKIRSMCFERNMNEDLRDLGDVCLMMGV